MMKFLLWFVLCSIIYVKVNCRRECIARDYGNTGTVCVCNITYCDNLDPITRTPNGVITLYESSLSGLRFNKTTIGTGNNNMLIILKQTVTLNCNTKYQKINCFGGSFTDSTGINIKSLPNSMQNTLLGDYFSANGIEYFCCRVPIAGTDFSTRPYTYDDTANDTTLSEFSLQPEDYDYKIPYIQLAKQLRANNNNSTLQLFACPWSSPVWIKTSNNITGGTIIGEPGTPYYQIWANYFVKFLDAYKNNSIEFWALTVQNEPSAIVRWNSLHLTPQQEREFIKLNLGPTLQQNGYGKDNLKLMIADDQRPGINLIVFNMPSVKDWATTILSDPDAAKYVSGVGFHWYWNWLFPDSTDLLDAIQSQFPQYFLLATEACNGYGILDTKVLLGSWQRGEAYAVDIIQDLNHFTTGWVDWNMALDTDGGPTWVDNNVDSPIIVNASANEYYKQPMFYVLGHFSKFLPPDSVRIGLTTDINVINFYTTAFQRPDNGIVVIAVNTNLLSVQLTIQLCNGTKIIREVLPHSIQTYIWWN